MLPRKTIPQREEKKRIFEFVLMIVVSIILVVLSKLEKNLFELSESLSTNREFFNSVAYFGLINVNVILILGLTFLIFRNVVKLVVERKGGVLGSKLRTKLVVSLVFFAVAPTTLLFYVSSRFLTESFETWFGSKVESTIAKTRDASSMIYSREGRRLESLARIALQRIDISPNGPFYKDPTSRIQPHRLEGFDTEYRLNSVKIYSSNGKLFWSSSGLLTEGLMDLSPNSFIMNTIERFIQYPGMTSRGTKKVEDGRDVVKGAAPIYDPYLATDLLGIVITEEKFDTQIIRSVEAILAEFASLKPGAQLIRLSYNILLLVIVLIIIFSATWLGFHVAKGIVSPIQTLAEASQKVASGNYDIELPPASDDETGHLIRSFKYMIDELASHRSKVVDFTKKLEAKNIELDGKRNYMEIVLKNISAGVISVDPEGNITAFNDAAKTLLGISKIIGIGQTIAETFPPNLFISFWQPIVSTLADHSEFHGNKNVQVNNTEITLIVDGNRIFDENEEVLGYVIVFSDTSEQLKAQRVAAWREVARRIAHEIKNPITPIKLSAQRLLRRFLKKFEGEEREVFGTCIETIISQVDTLRDLVNEFSKFSRLPTIKPKLQNLNDIIYEVRGLYSMSYPDIVFDVNELLESLPLIPIDKDQMSRVIGNLVVNAVAAIRQKETPGKIRFRTSIRKELSAIRLEVFDNGIGIPDSIKSKIFEPYFSTKSEGTGLGLAIVNQIVSDHGGYLRVGDVDRTIGGALIIIDLPMGDLKNDSFK